MKFQKYLNEAFAITDMYCEKKDIEKIMEILINFKGKKDYTINAFNPSVKGKPKKIKTQLYKLSIFNRKILSDKKINNALKDVCKGKKPPVSYEK